MDSRGYAGTINTIQYAELSRQWGVTCSILGPSTWEVVPETTVDRGLRIRRGTDGGQGYGYGILDTLEADVVKPADAVTSGTSRWDTVVARRDWRPRAADDTRDRTTFEVIKGGPQKAIAAGVLGPSGLGVLADQPIALARFVSDSSSVRELVDLRTWRGDGGITARSTLVRSFYDDLGTRLAIAEPGEQPRVWEQLAGTKADGTTVPVWWESVLGALPLLAAGAVIANGEPQSPKLPASTPFYAQIGTTVETTDGEGYVRVTWPVPFKNGLAVPFVWNGDASVLEDGSFEPSNRSLWGIGNRHYVSVRAWRTVDGRRDVARRQNVRMNYIAIGY